MFKHNFIKAMSFMRIESPKSCAQSFQKSSISCNPLAVKAVEKNVEHKGMHCFKSVFILSFSLKCIALISQ